MLDPATQLLTAKIAVPGVFGVAALCLLYQYFRTRGRYAWPQTEGRLLSARVAQGTRPGRRGKLFDAFWVEVNYGYTVSDIEFSGSRIAADTTYYTKSGPAENIVKVFKPGQQIPVYYNPKKPEEAFLVPGGVVGGMPLLLLGVGLAVADFALTFWFLSLD
ncbi:MAG TPA: DUF3592 domain-containing protein [Myxococcota bacterium]|nr:DUF3592 domain-containing protein [Myxococcota bacterium]